MKFHVLCSGSKGNCTVVESRDKFLIIDCGATKKYLLSCFRVLGLDYRKASALLITHDHSDHTRQLEAFSFLPVYSPCELEMEQKPTIISPLQIFNIDHFRIMALPLSHDSYNTVGYIIFDGEETLVLMTDTGYVSHSNEELIRNADYYIFESNYDMEMLMASRRPMSVKMRINSDSGHLSNQASAAVLSRIIGTNTREIVLAHISQECNTPLLARSSLLMTLEGCGTDMSKLRIHAAQQFEMYSGGRE